MNYGTCVKRKRKSLRNRGHPSHHALLKKKKRLSKCFRRVFYDKINDISCRNDEEPCQLLEIPFWWKDKTEKPSGIPPPIGNINDYGYEKFDKSLVQDVKISEKLEMDHPSKYIPGAIHRLQVYCITRIE